MKQYTIHQDSGHAWLEVPVAELVALGIANRITQYSYLSRDGQTAYLEEDVDLGTYLAARRVNVDDWLRTHCHTQHHNRAAPMRGYPRYDAPPTLPGREPITDQAYKPLPSAPLAKDPRALSNIELLTTIGDGIYSDPEIDREIASEALHAPLGVLAADLSSAPGEVIRYCLEVARRVNQEPLRIIAVVRGGALESMHASALPSGVVLFASVLDYDVLDSYPVAPSERESATVRSLEAEIASLPVRVEITP